MRDRDLGPGFAQEEFAELFLAHDAPDLPQGEKGNKQAETDDHQAQQGP